jgi:hypothetical protein
MLLCEWQRQETQLDLQGSPFSTEFKSEYQKLKRNELSNKSLNKRNLFCTCWTVSISFCFTVGQILSGI